MPKIQYFEIEFSDGDGRTAEWICIRGTDEPTLEEAREFLKKDSETIGLPVAGVYPIDEFTARACYDFDNESLWPIFSKEAKSGGAMKRPRKTAAKAHSASKPGLSWAAKALLVPVAASLAFIWLGRTRKQ